MILIFVGLWLMYIILDIIREGKNCSRQCEIRHHPYLLLCLTTPRDADPPHSSQTKANRDLAPLKTVLVIVVHNRLRFIVRSIY